MIRFDRNSGVRNALLLLIVVGFAFGGSDRDDVTSLMLLRPISVVALAFAVILLPRAEWRANRALVLTAFAWPLFTALQLIPLPPSVWHALAGRELATKIDLAVGMQNAWRPLSLMPYRTVNALFAMALPLAGLLLALSLPRQKLEPVVYLLFGIAVVSAALGLLQVIGGNGQIFYLYQITNGDSAVGLFANRNHNAIFLALIFPLIAATAAIFPTSNEQVRAREWLAAGVALLMIPFLLTTQSRAGLLLGFLTLPLAFWVYISPAATAQLRRLKPRFDPRMLFAGFAVVAMVGLTAMFTASNAIERLSRIGHSDTELRLQIWGPIAKLAGAYFPWGTGLGTFVEIYQVGEPDALLRPVYINHAHNDWLEIVLTGGLPFVLLVLCSAALLLARGLPALAARGDDKDRVLRRLGLVVCTVLVLGSVYDYPLRTPSLALLFAVAAVWLAGREGQKIEVAGGISVGTVADAC